MEETFWTCRNCNEQVEEQFEACWNCRHSREGLLVQSLSDERRETPIPTDKVPNRICLRCQTNMTYVGRKNFHEGMKWGMLGDLGELFINQTKLEMYFCSSCRHVEFLCRRSKTCAQLLLRNLVDAALPPDVRRGFASPEPKKKPGSALGMGLWPINIVGRRPEPRA